MDRRHAFDTATAVQRTEGGGLLAELDGGWDVGGGILNGGYLLAVAGRAAVLESPHAHPVALSGSYLRAPAAGPVTLTVQPGPAGRTLAHSLVTLADADGPALDRPGDDGDARRRALGLVGPDARRPLGGGVLLHRRAPSPGAAGRADPRAEPAASTPGWTPSTAGWAFGQPSGEPVIRAWMRFADGREPDPLALVTFADALPPTSFSMGNMGWAPTVQLQVLVRAVPAPGWCLVEARAEEVAGGWVDEDYRIWDSTGRLVAQSRQLARAPR